MTEVIDNKQNREVAPEEVKQSVSTKSGASADQVNTDTPKHGEKYNHPEHDNTVGDDNTKKADKPKRHGMENLVDMRTMTAERQREIASMGGKASQAKAKERKRAKEIAQAILQSNMTDAQINRILGKDKDLIGEDTSAYAVMMAKMVTTACKGDSKAATFVRDTAGDKPDDSLNVSATFTEGDKALMDKMAKRLGINEN